MWGPEVAQATMRMLMPVCQCKSRSSSPFLQPRPFGSLPSMPMFAVAFARLCPLSRFALTPKPRALGSITPNPEPAIARRLKGDISAVILCLGAELWMGRA